MFGNKRRKILKGYVSETDQFLHGLRSKCGRSASQLLEQQKYGRIFALRDDPDAVVDHPR